MEGLEMGFDDTGLGEAMARSAAEAETRRLEARVADLEQQMRAVRDELVRMQSNDLVRQQQRNWMPS